MPKRVHRKRMSKRGGGWSDNPGAEIMALPGTVAQGAKNVGESVYNVGATAVEQGKKGATGFWSLFGYDNQAAPATGAVVVPPQQQQVAEQQQVVEQQVARGGSRRRKRSGRKSKNMFSGLMKMVGFKTKRRGRKGGIGGPAQGYQEIVGANFPSAANAQGNNIYDLAPFDPSKPFTGGCMPNKLAPLTPASYPSGVSDMFGGKTRHRRKRSGGKSKKHGW